jgi:AraC-like DNA-binding protein
MAADALSDLLRTVRLTGAVFFDLDLSEPWAAETPPASECRPFVMPAAQHVIEFHVVTKGFCWAGLLDGEPIRLDEGDIVIFPQGDAHVMSSAPGMRAEPDITLYQGSEHAQLPFALTLGGAGPPTAHVVCGFLGCDSRPFNPLLEAMPRILHLEGGASLETEWLGHFIRAAIGESENKRAGGESILSRLSELMFVEVVRRYITSLPQEHTGWLAGLRDRHVGQALNLLHGRPAFAWTLGSLAEEVGLSRSALSDRFTHFVGVPPMHYLAHWRMQVAAGLLTNRIDTIARVAAEVGYDSQAAFSRTFKKLVGTPPATWRKGQMANRGMTRSTSRVST